MKLLPKVILCYGLLVVVVGASLSSDSDGGPESWGFGALLSPVRGDKHSSEEVDKGHKSSSRGPENWAELNYTSEENKSLEPEVTDSDKTAEPFDFSDVAKDSGSENEASPSKEDAFEQIGSLDTDHNDDNNDVAYGEDDGQGVDMSASSGDNTQTTPKTLTSTKSSKGRAYRADTEPKVQASQNITTDGSRGLVQPVHNTTGAIDQSPRSNNTGSTSGHGRRVHAEAESPDLSEDTGPELSAHDEKESSSLGRTVDAALGLNEKGKQASASVDTHEIKKSRSAHPTPATPVETSSHVVLDDDTESHMDRSDTERIASRAQSGLENVMNHLAFPNTVVADDQSKNVVRVADPHFVDEKWNDFSDRFKSELAESSDGGGEDDENTESGLHNLPAHVNIGTEPGADDIVSQGNVNVAFQGGNSDESIIGPRSTRKVFYLSVSDDSFLVDKDFTRVEANNPTVVHAGYAMAKSKMEVTKSNPWEMVIHVECVDNAVAGSSAITVTVGNSDGASVSFQVKKQCLPSARAINVSTPGHIGDVISGGQTKPQFSILASPSTVHVPVNETTSTFIVATSNNAINETLTDISADCGMTSALEDPKAANATNAQCQCQVGVKLIPDDSMVDAAHRPKIVVSYNCHVKTGGLVREPITVGLRFDDGTMMHFAYYKYVKPEPESVVTHVHIMNPASSVSHILDDGAAARRNLEDVDDNDSTAAQGNSTSSTDGGSSNNNHNATDDGTNGASSGNTTAASNTTSVGASNLSELPPRSVIGSMEDRAAKLEQMGKEDLAMDSSHPSPDDVERVEDEADASDAEDSDGSSGDTSGAESLTKPVDRAVMSEIAKSTENNENANTNSTDPHNVTIDTPHHDGSTDANHHDNSTVSDHHDNATDVHGSSTDHHQHHGHDNGHDGQAAHEVDGNVPHEILNHTAHGCGHCNETAHSFNDHRGRVLLNGEVIAIGRPLSVPEKIQAAKEEVADLVHHSEGNVTSHNETISSSHNDTAAAMHEGPKSRGASELAAVAASDDQDETVQDPTAMSDVRVHVKQPVKVSKGARDVSSHATATLDVTKMAEPAKIVSSAAPVNVGRELGTSDAMVNGVAQEGWGPMGTTPTASIGTDKSKSFYMSTTSSYFVDSVTASCSHDKYDRHVCDASADLGHGGRGSFTSSEYRTIDIDFDCQMQTILDNEDRIATVTVKINGQNGEVQYSFLKTCPKWDLKDFWHAVTEGVVLSLLLVGAALLTLCCAAVAIKPCYFCVDVFGMHKCFGEWSHRFFMLKSKHVSDENEVMLMEENLMPKE